MRSLGQTGVAVHCADNRKVAGVKFDYCRSHDFTLTEDIGHIKMKKRFY
jgi:hypothetical protein